MKKVNEQELRTLEGGKFLTGVDACNAARCWGCARYHAYCTKCATSITTDSYGRYLAFKAIHWPICIW